MGGHGYTTGIERPARDLQASGRGQDFDRADSAERDGQGYVTIPGIVWHYFLGVDKLMFVCWQ